MRSSIALGVQSHVPAHGPIRVSDGSFRLDASCTSFIERDCTRGFRAAPSPGSGAGCAHRPLRSHRNGSSPLVSMWTTRCSRAPFLFRTSRFLGEVGMVAVVARAGRHAGRRQPMSRRSQAPACGARSRRYGLGRRASSCSMEQVLIMSCGEGCSWRQHPPCAVRSRSTMGWVRAGSTIRRAVEAIRVRRRPAAHWFWW